MSVIPAALLAAGFVFGASSVGEAKPRSHSKSASKRATPAKKASSKARKPAKVHADVERVAVVTPELYGPFLPVEIYDHPRPLCTEHDSVAEARLHDVEEETPEADFTEGELENVVVPPPTGAMTRVARTLGALLRPKSAESTLRPEDVDLSELLSAGVQIPVEGVDADQPQGLLPELPRQAPPAPCHRHRSAQGDSRAGFRGRRDHGPAAREAAAASRSTRRTPPDGISCSIAT